MLVQCPEAASAPVKTCCATAQDAPAITRAALEGSDPLAVEAVDMFLAIIGAEAGYMGLRALATGGVYLCGGITPKARGNVSGVLAYTILFVSFNTAFVFHTARSLE